MAVPRLRYHPCNEAQARSMVPVPGAANAGTFPGSHLEFAVASVRNVLALSESLFGGEAAGNAR